MRTSEFEPHPQIRLQDFEDKVHEGKYISHDKSRNGFSNVVLEKPNGVRFRIIAIAGDVDSALALARGELGHA